MASHSPASWCCVAPKWRLMKRLLIIKQELINSRRLVTPTPREDGTLEILICK